MDKVLVKEITHEIILGFDAYLDEFRTITRQVKTRFENRDWHGIQTDSRNRLRLYKDIVKVIADDIRWKMGDDVYDKTTWHAIKRSFSQVIGDYNEWEIAETFFNSIYRKSTKDTGLDQQVLFVFSEQESKQVYGKKPICRVYGPGPTPQETVRKILLDSGFNIEFEDLERDVRNLTQMINALILSEFKADKHTRVEVLKPIFFRNKGAYLIGRVRIAGNVIPFTVPILNNENGLVADTLIIDRNELSVIFSFARSYFFVNVRVPSEMVRFLKSLMPPKGIDELYNAIGFNKHGKTEQYRSFLRHMKFSDDKFIVAPGIKGMVMSVFTLPSYHVVFKLIKDNFDPPKNTTHEKVKEQYKLVKEHDRVGRMADTHEFTDFVFPKDRFSPELLEELQTVAPSIVEVIGNEVRIKHLYTERKMIPLNIYLETANEDDTEEVIKEYGNAIKELAAGNIFPGDMLLKNFGVTRHKRVIFYDYDEICLLTDVKFRKIPVARYDDDDMGSDPWFAVEENDVFPEEFKSFLVGNPSVSKIFERIHFDLFGVKFWKEMQKKIVNKELPDVFPYSRQRKY